MTTAISQQFSDLTKHEEEFDDPEACQWGDCSETPVTHYALCGEGNCTSRASLCGTHTKQVRSGFYTHFRFGECGHMVPSKDVMLFPK
jgi:hypothetical protein